MALDLTTAIVSDLAGRVLASSLVSMQCALAARSPCWLGRADQPSLLPLHAERCPEPRAQVARRKPSLDDQRGACHRARIIAPQPCIRSVQRVPDHDAVMRIGGEAPRRRTHSRNRFQNHGVLRVTATSDRHRTLTMFCSSASESLSFLSLLPHAARNTTPAGTSPVVARRHKAISNLRARATIIVLRFLPPSVRVRYHWANALSF